MTCWYSRISSGSNLMSWMMRICLRNVDLPDSPAPNSNSFTCAKNQTTRMKKSGSLMPMTIEILCVSPVFGMCVYLFPRICQFPAIYTAGQVPRDWRVASIYNWIYHCSIVCRRIVACCADWWWWWCWGRRCCWRHSRQRRRHSSPFSFVDPRCFHCFACRDHKQVSKLQVSGRLAGRPDNTSSQWRHVSYATLKRSSIARILCVFGQRRSIMDSDVIRLLRHSILNRSKID